MRLLVFSEKKSQNEKEGGEKKVALGIAPKFLEEEISKSNVITTYIKSGYFIRKTQTAEKLTTLRNHTCILTLNYCTCINGSHNHSWYERRLPKCLGRI